MATSKDKNDDIKKIDKTKKETASKTSKATEKNTKDAAKKPAEKKASSTKTTSKTTSKTSKEAASKKSTQSTTKQSKDDDTSKKKPTKKTTSSTKNTAKKTTNQDLNPILKVLSNIETELKRAKLMIQQLQAWKSFDTDINLSLEQVASALPTHNDEGEKIIEGVYDGYFMIWSDKKKYPVPMNYASKSKLIPWDVLKLRVMEDGKLIYKLIGQADRKYIRATLTKTDDNKYAALSDEGTIYGLNQAAVTYYKGKTGDELSIIINNDWVGNFAAIEALIPQTR